MGPTDNIERYIKESGEDSMTLQKKQMGERNQIGMIIGMMITIAMIALEITSVIMKGVSIGRIITLVVGVGTVFMLLFGFKKKRYEDNYHHICIYPVFLLFLFISICINTFIILRKK